MMLLKMDCSPGASSSSCWLLRVSGIVGTTIVDTLGRRVQARAPLQDSNMRTRSVVILATAALLHCPPGVFVLDVHDVGGAHLAADRVQIPPLRRDPDPLPTFPDGPRPSGGDCTPRPSSGDDQCSANELPSKRVPSLQAVEAEKAMCSSWLGQSQGALSPGFCALHGFPFLGHDFLF